MSIEMYRGDTKTLNGTATLDGDPLDITGCSLTFTMKKKKDDYDPGIIQKTIGQGISIVSAVAGTYTITIDPEDTEELEFGGNKIILKYDIELQLVSGARYTIIEGEIQINKDVTSHVEAPEPESP